MEDSKIKREPIWHREIRSETDSISALTIIFIIIVLVRVSDSGRWLRTMPFSHRSTSFPRPFVSGGFREVYRTGSCKGREGRATGNGRFGYDGVSTKPDQTPIGSNGATDNVTA